MHSRIEALLWIEDINIGKSAVLSQLYLLKNICAMEEVKSRMLISGGSFPWEVLCEIKYKRLLSGCTFT